MKLRVRHCSNFIFVSNTESTHTDSSGSSNLKNYVLRHRSTWRDRRATSEYGTSLAYLNELIAHEIRLAPG